MKLLVADDSDFMREVIRATCMTEGFSHFLEAVNGKQAIEMVINSSPDVLLLDLGLPEIGGLRVIEILRQMHSLVPILVFSGFASVYTSFGLEHMQIQGFIGKTASGIAEVKNALIAIARGGKYFSAEFERIKAARRSNAKSFERFLTDRELEVLLRVGDLMSDDEIAGQLQMTVASVLKHRSNIGRKLGVAPRVELERYAQVNGCHENLRSGIGPHPLFE